MFSSDIANGAFKDLSRSRASDKVLRDKTFAIISGSKYDEYQRGLVSMVYKFFDRKFIDTSTHTRTRIVSENQQLANELNRPITRKFKKHEVYLSF